MSATPERPPAWPKLRDLALDAWQAWDEAVAEPGARVLEPSLPLPFVGDAERYLGSDVRVLTVTLSPPRGDFPADDPAHRFPDARRVDPATAGDWELDEYLDALGRYFRTRPGNAPYAAFVPFLEGLGATYDGRGDVALHTYLRSPVVTSVAWSKLTPAGRETLEARGPRLWHRAVAALEPDVIVVSTTRADLRRVELESYEPFTTAHRAGEDGDYAFQSKLVRVGTSRAALVFAPAGLAPFGTASPEDRQAAGAAVRTRLGR